MLWVCITKKTFYCFFSNQETVVVSTTDPDTYIVYRKYKVNSLSILEKNIGSKKHYLHMSSSAQGIFLYMSVCRLIQFLSNIFREQRRGASYNTN